MICSFCGSVVSRGAAFCSQCGAPQTQAVDQKERSRGPASEGFRHWGPPDAVTASEEVRDRSLELQQPQQPYLEIPRNASNAEIQVPSFKKRATAAFFLYLVAFFPGLIASAFWWNQASDYQHRTGIAPPGKNTLTALLILGIATLVLWILWTASNMN
jgi:hypothetical protein